MSGRPHFVDHDKWDRRIIDKCIAFPSSTPVAGAALNVWDCTGGVEQRFAFNGTGPIQCEADQTLCFDAGNGAAGARVTLQKGNGSPEQTWSTNPRGNLASAKNPANCINDVGNGRTNGNAIDLWACPSGTTSWKYGS